MIKKKSRRIGKTDYDTLLSNALLLILIGISVISVVVVQDYIGLIVGHGAKGGVITNLNIYQRFIATNWNGVYGIVIQSPLLNTSWFIFSNPGGMNEINPIFTCLEPGKSHEVYLTHLNSTEIDWGNVTAGTTQMVDDFTNTPYNLSNSATQTFTRLINVQIGENTIAGVPAAYMRAWNNPGGSDFPVGILQYDGNIIMVALINENFLLGYRPDKIFNYELMVPVPPNATNYKYNLYPDPYDECPQGQEGETFENGGVYGWVKDNSSGVLLENVLVAVERKIYITGPDGYFNISDLLPGNYHIVALKAGFNNYVGNITIYQKNSTEHNISMILYVEPQTGTGPGIGTGVGPGQDAPGTETQTGIGPGVGPGVGPGIGPFIEKPEELGIDHFISLDALKKRIRIGNFFTEDLLIFSFKKEPVDIEVTVSGNVSELLELSETEATIEQNQHANISIRGFGLKEGIYTGSIDLSGDFNDSLPVIVTVTDEEKLPVEALLIQLDILTNRPLPGNNFRYRVNLQNLLTEEGYNVRLDYLIKGVDSNTMNYSMYVGNDTISLLTSYSVIKDVMIPPDWPKGDYYLIVEANYLDLNSRTSTIFEVFEPLYKYKVLGVLELWKLLVGLSVLAFLIGIILYIRHRMNATKRFHAKVEYNLLPKKGPRSLYVGKIAETENDTFMDMDKLTVHSIIAGSTGGGKSISAQVIVEEALLKGVAVIVFDPTAQWSGMLRKCADEKMLGFYPRFKMTKKDARAFPGNIRAIKNAKEKIELQKYWKPGEIQVFTTSTLDPKDMDLFVANTVREVFHSNLQEYRGLRYMMVYDEVHRLLPKFGGSGEGFVQIERACREFRKWGIGVMLISQVLADFVGQIKANINTEIQMKTRDEGDLARIETKYGKTYIQELVKAPVGSGMVQNSDWNRGKPYYITFRPIMHSVIRLSDEELEKYNKYNEMVDDLSYQLEQLEQEGKDVFDLKLELKLALDKIKSGSFNMVEIYLEGLRPRIEKIWKDMGKTPKKRELNLISESELKEAITAAKAESEKAKAAEMPGAVGGEGEKKALGLNDDVPPAKMLKLVNGTLVVKLKALLDEIKVLKDDEYKKHINEDKNDFSDWIRDALGNDKWADIADPIMAKEDYIAFLESLDQGKEKSFKPAVARPKPYSSKKVAAQPASSPQVAAPSVAVPSAVQQPTPAATAPQSAAPQSAPSGPPSVASQPQLVQPQVMSQPVIAPVSQPQPAQMQAAASPAQQPQALIQALPVKPQQPESQQISQVQNAITQPQQAVRSSPAVIPVQAAQPSLAQPSPQPMQALTPQIDWVQVKQKLAALPSAEKISYLKELLAKVPGEQGLLFTLAAEYHRTGDLANAEIWYKKMIEASPVNPKAYYYLGSLYTMQKKYKESLDAYKKVLEQQPDYPKAKEYVESLSKIVNQVAA